MSNAYYLSSGINTQRDVSSMLRLMLYSQLEIYTWRLIGDRLNLIINPCKGEGPNWCPEWISLYRSRQKPIMLVTNHQHLCFLLFAYLNTDPLQ